MNNLMKKIKILITIFFLIFVLCSCGGNTNGWPVINLPFESDDVYKIEINYTEKGRYATQEEQTIVDDELINYICYEIQGYVYKVDYENYDKISSWVIRFKIDFYINNYESNNYSIIFYNQGISKGYVEIDHTELHFLPGDVASFYEDIKREL